MAIVNAVNEEKALKLMKKTCEEILAGYLESLEEDLNKLKSSSLSYNERNCLNYVSNEKKVLFVL